MRRAGRGCANRFVNRKPLLDASSRRRASFSSRLLLFAPSFHRIGVGGHAKQSRKTPRPHPVVTFFLDDGIEILFIRLRPGAHQKGNPASSRADFFFLISSLIFFNGGEREEGGGAETTGPSTAPPFSHPKFIQLFHFCLLMLAPPERGAAP